MDLTDVSKTALGTMRCHVIEAKKAFPLLRDPMAIYAYDKLLSLVGKDSNDQILSRKIPTTLINHIVLRARKYDQIINEYIKDNESVTIVNIGCGFDTRYWRIENKKCTYIELDLPEVIAIKRKVLAEYQDYEMIGSSVFDTSWIEQVTANSKNNFLIVAEGLLMYLPQKEVVDLFRVISESFNNSRMVFEVCNKKYTEGIWKKMIEFQMKMSLGLEAGSSFNFGVNSALDVETFGNNLKIIDQWSYLEDKDVRPKIMSLFANNKTFSRTEWTIIMEIFGNKNRLTTAST